MNTWLEVNLASIYHNLASIRSAIGREVEIIAVVKANGYGLGLVEIARAMIAGGAGTVAVATLDEALQLRRASFRAPILVLGSIPPGGAEEAVVSGITCTLCDPQVAEALSAAALRLQRAATIEIKVDSGMGRLGVSPRELPEFVAAWGQLPGLSISGIYSHFSSAEETDQAFSRLQLEQFLGVREQMYIRQPEPGRWRWHIANSAGTVAIPESHLDAVRVGLLAYGVNPIPGASPISLLPTVTWKSRITYIKELAAGSPVSYNRSCVLRKRTRVVSLGVGYADGYPRSLSGCGEVLIGGVRAPVLGRVCMDQMMVAAPEGVDVRVGDEAVLLGRQGGEHLSVEEVCARAGVIPHELLSRLGTRMPRCYSTASGVL